MIRGNKLYINITNHCDVCCPFCCMKSDGKKQFVDGDIYTNTIEGFWSILKRGIIGIYHHMSKKHLQLYANEFAFRYNTRQISEGSRFKLFLCNAEKKLTYQNIIAVA